MGLDLQRDAKADERVAAVEALKFEEDGGGGEDEFATDLTLSSSSFIIKRCSGWPREDRGWARERRRVGARD